MTQPFAARAPLLARAYAAFLFDMDGTILSSIAATERAWGAWARSKGIDVESFLPTIHGVRGIDTIARLGLPGVDPVAEAETVMEMEIADTGGIAPIGGAVDFLHALPKGRWAIVTSAPRELALKRIAVAGLPVPDLLVTAEDVTNGKPSPDGYLLAADRLGVSIGECLVFEDAPAGIAAGAASGATVAVITALHAHAIETKHAAIPNYADLMVEVGEGPLPLRIVARG